MIEKLVSTVIPVYNRPALLREAVSSVLGQTYRPIEIIIVDDGSTDSTKSVAKSIADENKDEVMVIHSQHSGPGLAREEGRKNTKGEFIQYLDSDDILLADKFEVQVAGLIKHPLCGIAYGKTRFRLADGRILSEAWKQTGHCISKLFPSMLVDRWWGTSTPLYRRSVTDAAGPWLSLNTEEDWEYDCRIALQELPLHFTPQVLSEERDHAAGRMSREGSKDPAKLADRCKARQTILSHALSAQIDPETREFKLFLKSTFLVARQSAAVGLERESQELIEAIHAVSPRLLSSLFLASGRIVGFRSTARLAEAAHRFFRGNLRGA